MWCWRRCSCVPCSSRYIPPEYKHIEVWVILRIFQCACAKRPYFHFRSIIWHNHRIHRPRLPVGRRIFGDSHTFNAFVGLSLIFACILRTSSPKMGGYEGKMGERVVRCLPPTNVLLLEFLLLCQFLWKFINKCEHDSARRRTQSSFIICPMLHVCCRCGTDN